MRPSELGLNPIRMMPLLKKGGVAGGWEGFENRNKHTRRRQRIGMIHVNQRLPINHQKLRRSNERVFPTSFRGNIALLTP
jgi:hypothetical protein